MVKLWINKSESYSEFLKKENKNDTLYSDEYEYVHFKKESKDSIDKQYHLTKKQIIFRDHIYTENEFIPVIVSENMPNYNWILEEGTKVIGGYKCNKASLDFRGRHYNVWYTTEVPTQFGPWKFYGLPGLIVTIQTDDNSIFFQLSKLSFGKFEKMKKPSQGKNITFEQYKKYQEKIVADFIEKIKSKMPRGSVVKVNSTDSNTIEKNYE
ncbi:MAG: GLPGLI family protein [Flavobacterium sp.]|nr:GLPGLI family protein [Flavobacterium sp.]